MRDKDERTNTMSAARHSIVSGSTKEFPPFRLDTVNECLWRHQDGGDDERIRLAPTAFAMLRYLVERAGRLVSQDELLEALWPETFVQPEVLKSHILNLRHALGDDAKHPRFIETLPRRGYQFIAPVEDAPTTETAVDLPCRKIVGRDTQLDELADCLQRSLGNQRQVVFVTGETGIGKTTLVDEFVRRAASDFPGIRIARGQCVEGYGGKEAYYPMLEALSQLCGGSGSDTVVRTLAAQAPSWLVQFPALIRREQREMLQREIVGATRERMLREIGEALETITSEKPLLLVLEDLHWADPFTVDLISVLARRRASGKLMLIGTYRPADVTLAEHPLKTVKQDLLVHHLCREIALQALTEAEVAEYLAIDSPGGAAVPEGLAALIFRHSEGNPLFMVITLDHMRDRGLIAVENGSWQVKTPLERISLEAPESLRQMIELQIERLSTEEQRALELASVSGLSFTANMTALSTTEDQERFESLCEDLSRRQHMVRRAGSHQFPDGTISQCYEFAHALYREVFYRRQAPGRRTGRQMCVGEFGGQPLLSV